MTKKEVKKVLSALIIEEDDNVFIKTRKNRRVSLNVFLEMFGECELNKESLLENEKATEENGWLYIFKEWKQKGYIN